MISLFSLVNAGSAYAQGTGRITGTVRSESGQAIAGASVEVVGTGLGVQTGEDGRYLLANVPAGAQQVRARVIGYGAVTRAVTVVGGGVVTADFELTTQAVQLEGIVAVGYGTQQRRTVTGAVSSVRSAQLAEIATADPIKAIQGRVAGVEVVSSNNLPGAPMNIRIRGVRSLTASNEPLYVVDGVPIAGGIADFNPASIASIEILKDAAATAIYGSRGANGVVLITTKTGAESASLTAQFTLDAYAGVQRPLQLVDMMNMQQYTEMLQAAARYAGRPDDVTSVLDRNELRAAYEAGIETDWQREILRTGQQKNFQVGLSGLTGSTRFNVSGNYFDQRGLAEGQDFHRASAVLSFEHTLKRLRLGVTANGSRSVQDQGAGDGLWSYALAQTGFGAPYTPDGLLDIAPDGEVNAVNPVRAQKLFFNQITRNRLFTSAFAELQLLDGVSLRVNFGPDLTNADSGSFQGPATTYPKTADSRAQLAKMHLFAYTLDNLLQLSRDFGPSHHVDATLLYGIQRQKFNQEFASAQQLPYMEQLWYNLGSGTNFTVRSNLSEWALQSYMGRVSYTFNTRYTISGAIRRDGSSRLAEGNKWANFPSVGVAWQVGDEPFMRRLGFLNAMKLRGSYGVTGNTAVDPYQTQGALSFVVYNWGGNYTYGYGPNDSNPANPNLSWEKTYKTNIGVDVGVFDNRVAGAVDWYLENTKDLIMRQTLPKTSGYSSALLNIGETKNTGVEVQLSTVNLRDWNGVRWTTDVSWAHNRNEIVKLANANAVGCPNNLPCDKNNGWFVGEPINISTDAQRRVWYDYRMIGIWQLGEEEEAASFGNQFKPGEIRILDANGDGRITADDRIILGNTHPKWTGSVYNRVSWKTLDLSALATIRWGYTLFDNFGAATNSMQGRFGNIVTDYWTPGNPSNTQPAPRISGNEVPYRDTRGYLDGSHWRVRNITLGYTVPGAFARRLGAGSARIYATAQDPFFVSDYHGYDPENGTSGGAPAYRTLLLGANVVW